jgi:hypothetical protein
MLSLLLDRSVYRLLRLTVINVVWLDATRVRSTAHDDARFTFRFLAVDEVREFAADPANQLQPPFVERSAVGRDLCFAAVIGGTLAAYGWYALEAIEAEHAFGVAMSFPGYVAYMYNGFTHADFRGARLHGAIMTQALQQLAERGITKLVSLVDWTNAASMQSCYRSGYELLGQIVLMRLPMRDLVIAPRRAKALGIRFGEEARRRRAGE